MILKSSDTQQIVERYIKDLQLGYEIVYGEPSIGDVRLVHDNPNGIPLADLYEKMG